MIFFLMNKKTIFKIIGKDKYFFKKKYNKWFNLLQILEILMLLL